MRINDFPRSAIYGQEKIKDGSSVIGRSGSSASQFPKRDFQTFHLQPRLHPRPSNHNFGHLDFPSKPTDLGVIRHLVDVVGFPICPELSLAWRYDSKPAKSGCEIAQYWGQHDQIGLAYLHLASHGLSSFIVLLQHFHYECQITQ